MSAPDEATGLAPLTIVAMHIDEFGDGTDFDVRRTRVPGGWLLITSASVNGDNALSIAVASTFVPDESGAWLSLGNADGAGHGPA